MISKSVLAALRGVALAFLIAVAQTAVAQEVDPLSSWNEGSVKAALVDFVARVTDETGPGYVAPEERIATFDNDGTLWVEQPMYTQIVFLEEEAERLWAMHPEWKNDPGMKALLDRNRQHLIDLGENGFADFQAALQATTDAGRSHDELLTTAKAWTSSAVHPRFGHLYIDCTYLPQIELMDYLRANDFKVFIVSGGDITFIRSWAEGVYGVAPPNVVGSSIDTSFSFKDHKGEVIREPKVDFVTDGAGKAEGIDLHIGQRPILAFGNSGGDKQMLEYAKSGNGERMALILYHDDAEREYAYGPAGGLPNTGVGVFPQDLMDQAKSSGWYVVSMKSDWKRIFSFEEPGEDDAAAVRPAPDAGGEEEGVRQPS
jgi:phosphoserine phosphatase